MKFLVLDFETLWADDYTLSKMTAEEYIRDPLFEIIGVSLGWLGEQPQWYSGDLEYIKSVLHQLPWHDIFVIGHNMSGFDSLILTEIVGVRPAFYGCTLQLARCIHGGKTADGKNISNALGALCRMYGLPDKGNEVIAAKNKRRLDFTPAELAAYGEYCNRDAALCGMLWQKLSVQFPKSELYLAHLCTKMWAEPRLVLDGPLLEAMGVEIAQRKSELLTKVADLLGVGTTMSHDERMFHTQKLLRSDAKFAELLTSYDVEVPMKRSPKKRDAEGKALMVYAFAKTDEAMTNLQEYEEQDEETNLAVQALTTARLGTKSTIAESRVARFHGISMRGPLTVPLEYGKTLTHRLAGGGKINMQNMNQIKPITPRTPNGALIMTVGGWSYLHKRKLGKDREGKTCVVAVMDIQGRVWCTDPENKELGVQAHVVGLRDVIQAPPGYKLVVADSSNIELRTGHLFCGQMDSSDLLARGEDLYCDFATSFYGRGITKADKKERQHGKVAELQLMYQAAAESFRRAARIMGGIRLNEVEAQTTVDVYRAKRSQIKQMWYTGQKAVKAMMEGSQMYLDQWGLCRTERNAIVLPNGMKLQYSNLRTELLMDFDGLESPQIVYDDKEKRKMTKLYGGKVFQNINQALARNVVMEQTIEIEKKYGTYNRPGEGVVMSTHDEAGVVVREDHAEECLAFMLAAMHESPKWWPQLKVKAEGGIGQRYSDAK